MSKLWRRQQGSRFVRTRGPLMMVSLGTRIMAGKNFVVRKGEWYVGEVCMIMMT